MYRTRSVTRKQCEGQMDSPTDNPTDSNDQVGSAPAVDGPSLPFGQEAGRESAINIGVPDIASFGSLDEFLNQAPLQQEQQEELQSVLYSPTVADKLAQPYFPWDCPGSDEHLDPFPLPAMANAQRYLSPSYYVDPNFFTNAYMHQHQHQQHQHQQSDDYQSFQPWVSPALEQAAVLDLRDTQSHVGELLFENSTGSYEPLPFEYPAVPDRLMLDPLLDERWAATYEGDLFEHPQALQDTIQSEAVPPENLQEASSPQPPAAIAPIAQEHQQALPDAEALAPAHPAIPLVLAGRKVDIEKARRRRLGSKRRRGPKPKVKVDWLPRGADRETKDRFLVESRANEISYKLIKQYGRFQEAESTLRGRYRTLTKAKEARVRDPKWTPIDIQLLKEAVQMYAGVQHPDRVRISWMMVSRYITNHGGTYAFGYTTCHRRWLHLAATGQLGDSWIDESWEAHNDEENNEEEEGDEMDGVETEASDEDEDEGEDEDEDDDENYEED